MPATKARNIRQFNVAWIRHRAASLALERSALLIVLELVLVLVLDVFRSISVGWFYRLRFFRSQTALVCQSKIEDEDEDEFEDDNKKGKKGWSLRLHDQPVFAPARNSMPCLPKDNFTTSRLDGIFPPLCG